jgi:RNA polymerase sigma factor (sigma-70 family)
LTASPIPHDRAEPASGRDAEAPPTDAELVAAVRNGDQRVSGELYLRLRAPIDRALLRVFGRREQDHEDFVQITLEQVVDSIALRRFRHQCSLSTWGSLIGSRVALGEIRRRARRGPHDEPPEPLPGPIDEDQRLHARQLLRAVRRALASLGRRSADVVYLVDVEGYSEAEASRALGISASATHTRLVRGRQRMKALLGDTLGAANE